MKDMIKITLSLVAIFVAAGVIMGVTYKYTSPVRFLAEKKEKEEALKKMAPDATDPIVSAGTWTGAKEKSYEYYKATSQGKTVAYIAETAGKGYSSYVAMLVSLDIDLNIREVNILHHGETPGLGDQIEEGVFLDQFKGKSLLQLVLLKKETKENIQAITGATISSRAVTNGVKDAVEMLVEKYGAGLTTAQEAAP